MDAPIIQPAYRILQDSVRLIWSAITGATNYLLDISDDDFSTYITADIFALTTILEHNNSNIYSINTIGDSTFTWTIDQYAGYAIEIVSGTGAGQRRKISSNTATTLTVNSNWSTTPDATSDFRITRFYEESVSLQDFDCFDETNVEIIGLTDQTLYSSRVIATDGVTPSSESDVVEFFTGMYFAQLSIEDNSLSSEQQFLNQLSFTGLSIEHFNPLEGFNMFGVSIEILIEYNLKILIKDTDENPLENCIVSCIDQDWTNKGTWDADTNNPDLSLFTPSENDFYEVTVSGTNDLTGEDENWEVGDIALYVNSTWQRKVKKFGQSDAQGYVYLVYEIDKQNDISITKTGFQKYMKTITSTYGKKIEQFIILYKIIPIVITSSGYAVNTNPSNKQNKIFN